MITGTEAAEVGLADFSVVQNENGDAAYQRALQLAEEILPRGPVAVRMAKLAINKGMQVVFKGVELFLPILYLHKSRNTPLLPLPPPPPPKKKRIA